MIWRQTGTWRFNRRHFSVKIYGPWQNLSYLFFIITLTLRNLLNIIQEIFIGSLRKPDERKCTEYTQHSSQKCKIETSVTKETEDWYDGHRRG